MSEEERQQRISLIQERTKEIFKNSEYQFSEEQLRSLFYCMEDDYAFGMFVLLFALVCAHQNKLFVTFVDRVAKESNTHILLKIVQIGDSGDITVH